MCSTALLVCRYWHGATPGWIRAKAGLQYCGFVTGFIKDEPPWYQVNDAFERLFRERRR